MFANSCVRERNSGPETEDTHVRVIYISHCDRDFVPTEYSFAVSSGNSLKNFSYDCSKFNYFKILLSYTIVTSESLYLSDS